MIEKAIWNPETGIEDPDTTVNALSASQIPGIKAVWEEQRKRLKKSPQLHEFTERLSREWAIETGIIEDLYEIDRGVTQTLIERGFQDEFLAHGSTNKPRAFVIDLLKDQKATLDGIFDFVKSQRNLSTSYIKELHAVLLNSQQKTEGEDSQGRSVFIPLIKGDWKKQPNSPVRDGIKYNYCPPEQVASEMDKLIKRHKGHESKGLPIEIQAAWLHHRFTQIHPFQDGNGRVARAITSLVLVKSGLFPFVVTRDERLQYIDTLESADDGDLKPLIDLITKLQIRQFRKASTISEAILVEEDLYTEIDEFLKVAKKSAADRLERFKTVFHFANDIENDIQNLLEDIKPKLLMGLRAIEPDSTVFVSRSKDETSYYFRAQIIENAKRLDYFADTSEYRSWVTLNLYWSRRAKIVFTIHGIGKLFNGSLICAPFMEIKDVEENTDEEGKEMRITLVPIAEDGFIFFYNEDLKKLMERFVLWRQSVLKVAVRELTQNLRYLPS